MIAKQVAAIAAVNEVVDKMTIGLGTGSTAAFAISEVGKKVKGGLSIKAVASSIRSEEMARDAGIDIIPFNQVTSIDLYIDGADEVDRGCNLIKGGGGALLREKILAYNSKRFIVVIDESKIVPMLGAFPLAVEVTQFAMELTMKDLEKLGCKVVVRKSGAAYFKTDNGNFIIDCNFKKIVDPAGLETLIDAIPGVVESGLFPAHYVNAVYIGNKAGEVKIMNP